MHIIKANEAAIEKAIGQNRHSWPKLKKSVPVEGEMLTSKAWQELTKAETTIWLHLLNKCHHWHGKGKNHKIYTEASPFTYAEAKERYSISSTTFRIGIKHLVEKGCIKIEYTGGRFGGAHDYSRYITINDWKNYGSTAFTPRTKPKGRNNGVIEEHNKKRIQERKPQRKTANENHLSIAKNRQHKEGIAGLG